MAQVATKDIAEMKDDQLVHYIRDSREHTIFWVRLNDTGPQGFTGAERDVAARLVADYERRPPE